MRLTAGALAALALAVLGLLLAVDAASRVGSDGLAVTVMLVAAGGSAIVAGAMAALHRPDSVFGVLLEAAGCLWFVSEWNSPTAGSAMVFTVGLICWAAFPIVAAHAALAFPSGRLVSPVDRLLIIAGYAVFVGLIGLVPTLVFDPVAQGCRACASNLVLVTSSPALVGVFGGWGAGCAVLVATSLAVLGVVRLVRSTPAARRMKSVVLGPSVLLLLAVAITFVRAVNPATVPQDQLSRVLWWVQAAALTALSAGVVIDWIRLRRARSRIASFVIALGVGGRTGDIRAALAAALHDPSLDVAYPLADGRLVSASGEPAPAADDDRATTALVRGNSTVALIRHQRDLLGDPALVREVVSAARLPLDNERLSAEARAQLTELGASRVRIIESGEAERRRLERDLHDGAQQRLVALALGVRLARSTTSDPENAARFDRAAELLGSAIADLRRLASGIYPSVLADTGLSGGLSALAEESDHPVRISDVPRGRLALVVEATAYLLVAAVCRCGAVTVRAAVDDGALKLAIDADAIPENLIDVTDRINALGGSITVGPSAGGWSVRAEVPCAS